MIGLPKQKLNSIFKKQRSVKSESKFFPAYLTSVMPSTINEVLRKVKVH